MPNSTKCLPISQRVQPGGEKRKVNIAISAMGMDYRGLPVIHMETRRKKYAMKLPIDAWQQQSSPNS